eukprot:COSAG02_NODE_52763_length_306_cov_0.420290_1_plen_39_part_01
MNLNSSFSGPHHLNRVLQYVLYDCGKYVRTVLVYVNARA